MSSRRLCLSQAQKQLQSRIGTKSNTYSLPMLCAIPQLGVIGCGAGIITASTPPVLPVHMNMAHDVAEGLTGWPHARGWDGGTEFDNMGLMPHTVPKQGRK